MMDPNKSKKVAKVLALVIAIVMILTTLMMGIPMFYGDSGNVVYAAGKDVVDEESLTKELDFMKLLMENVKESYKDEVSYETLVNGAYKGIFDALEDPYSVYYEEAEVGNDFMESATGEFSGIGVSIQSYDGKCKIVAPIANTPAERAGLKSGDFVVKVDGVSVEGKTIDECQQKMRGPAGSKVTLTISRNGALLNFTMAREKIKTVSVNYRMESEEIGYIQITQFDSDSDNEFKVAQRALRKQGMKSLIVDVRNNPGGLVNTATNIADTLIQKKDQCLVRFTQQGKEVDRIMTMSFGVPTVPTVILVNEGSASASEIFAGAMKDNKAAVLVGTTTYGKGVAQQVADLKNGGSMKLSLNYFTTPNGTVIDKKGIAPDYYVKNGLGLSEKEVQAEYAKLAPMTEAVKYKKGQTGLNVYAAQQRLNVLGSHLTVNGTMDANTVAAIARFQREQGMKGYGGLDYSTMSALEKAVNSYLTGIKEDKQLEKAVSLLK